MSAKDPIEELFRDNQHGLDEQPRGLLWDKIEESLDEKQVVSRKLNWWKYAAAASVVAGMTIGVWALLNNENTINSEMTNPQIVLEDTSEINEENASQILDKLEENKQSVVVREEKKSAPEIMENEMEHASEPMALKIPEPMMKPEPVYDVAPAAEMSAAPALAEEKSVISSETTAAKTEAGYALKSKSKVDNYELEDARRMGNMETKISYDTIYYKKTVKQLPVRLSNKTIHYDLIENTSDSVVFFNSGIPFPQRIIFNNKGGILNVEYKGDPNKKNSKESTQIQHYINNNKNAIYKAGIESGIEID